MLLDARDDLTFCKLCFLPNGTALKLAFLSNFPQSDFQERLLAQSIFFSFKELFQFITSYK
jgi:hypothetical protein